MGAGGGWLSKILNYHQFNQLHYPNFHFICDPAYFFHASHLSHFNYSVEFSGQYKFNFFCNHVWKFYHLDKNQYKNFPYSQWFKEAVADSFGLCKFCNYTDKPYFDFDDLIYQSDVFYQRVIELQKINNKFVISKEYFEHARDLFLKSCVNTSLHFNNFESPWWVMFVLGQLMDQAVHPDFDIGNIDNFSKIKQFVKDNVSHCPPFVNWNNPWGVDIDIKLPL